MKRLILLSTLFIASITSAISQNAFPVRAKDPEATKAQQSPLMSTSKLTGAIWITTRPQVTSATSSNVSTTIEPGKKFALEGIQILCDRPYYIGVTVRKTSMSFNNTTESTYFTLGEKQFSVTLPYKEMLFEGGAVIVSGQPSSGNTAQDQGSITMRLIGRSSSLFEIDNPDFRILVIADSKALYTLDAGSYGERYYTNQLAKLLQGYGKKVSVIDKTMPGASSSDMVKQIKSGAIDNIPYDLLVVAYGTNNAGSTASTANLNQYKADLAEAILHRNRTNPNASVVFMTPGVTDKTSLLPNIDGYRTAASEVANDASIGTTARKVYLCQEHLAFTPSTSTKSDRFIASEALNNQLHYSMLGHDEVFNNRFLPLIQTTYFWKNVLLLP